MKVIVVGNSQVGSLRSARNRFPAEMQVDFFAIPGGGGPALALEDERIKPKFAEHTVHAAPESLATEGVRLNDYDALVFSALGLSGTQVRYKTTLCNRLGPAEWLQPDAPGVQAVSRAVFVEAVDVTVSRLRATHSLRLLRKAFEGPIIVQPFPFPSQGVVTDSGSPLDRLYGDKLSSMLLWFYDRQYSVMDAIIRSLPGKNVLLEHADPKAPVTGFTDALYSQNNNSWHMNTRFGARVIDQISTALAEFA